MNIPLQVSTPSVTFVRVREVLVTRSSTREINSLKYIHPTLRPPNTCFKSIPKNKIFLFSGVSLLLFPPFSKLWTDF